MLRGYVSEYVSRGVCRLDVKGGEIGLLKSLINKGFSRVMDFLPDVWQSS